MNCPKCKTKSPVLGTRDKDLFIYRRYECPNCKQRFSTHETVYMIGARTQGSDGKFMKEVRAKSSRGKPQGGSNG